MFWATLLKTGHLVLEIAILIFLLLKEFMKNLYTLLKWMISIFSILEKEIWVTIAKSQNQRVLLLLFQFQINFHIANKVSYVSFLPNLLWYKSNSCGEHNPQPWKLDKPSFSVIKAQRYLPQGVSYNSWRSLYDFTFLTLNWTFSSFFPGLEFSGKDKPLYRIIVLWGLSISELRGIYSLFMYFMSFYPLAELVLSLFLFCTWGY